MSDRMEPFRLIAESTYDWESWIAPDGKLLWVNPAIERLTGYAISDAEAETEYPISWVVSEDRERVFEAHEDAKRGGSGNDLEFRLRTKAGTIRWFAMSYQPMRADDDRPLGFRTSVRDIQERKVAEERLVEAMTLAEQAARAKENFLASMSHELRTPLQCIVGYGELASDVVTDERAARYLRTITEQSHELLRLISNILDLASSRSGVFGEVKTVFDTVELREELSALLELVSPLARSRELEVRADVSADVPRKIALDRARYRQILLNLLGNAIKFTASGSVALEVGIERSSREARLVTRIVDTGPGIAAEFLPRLFEPFAQAEAGASRRFGGSGLGLYISRRLAAELGGTLELGTTTSKGTSFLLSIPFRDAFDVGETEPSSRVSGFPSSRVLEDPQPLSLVVIDDSRVVLDLLGELLGRLGQKPRLFSDGSVALGYLEEAKADIVFVDLHMPKLDGVSLAKEVRRMNLPRQPYIVGMSADPFARGVTRDEGGPMDSFSVKPIGLHRLDEVLRRVARRNRSGVEEDGVEFDERVVGELEELRVPEGGSMLARMVRRVEADTTALLGEFAACDASERGRAEASHLLHRLKGNCLMLGIRSGARLCELGAATPEALRRHLESAFELLRRRTVSRSDDSLKSPES